MMLTALECRVSVLDAHLSHAYLTVMPCKREELTFASVHDSYWTHASTVDKMSEIIRDTFVYLHSSDIMGRLVNEVRVDQGMHQNYC